jgi:ribosomal protein S16
MLTIRLSRMGKKKQPVYRFIVLEKSKDPWG